MNIEAEERLKLNTEDEKRNGEVNKNNKTPDWSNEKKDEKESEWDEEKEMNWMLERGKEVTFPHMNNE